MAVSKEKILRKSWSQVLGISSNKIMSTSNFFMLGGDSISLLQLIACLEEKFRCQLSFEEFYRTLTFSKQLVFVSRLIEKEICPNDKRVDQLNIQSLEKEYQATSAQQGIWYLSQLDPGLYTESFYLKFTEVVDNKLIEKAFWYLHKKHPVLTSKFYLKGKMLYCKESKPRNISNNIIHVRYGCLYKAQKVWAETPLDLFNNELIKVQLINVDNRYAVLCISISHIITDALSINVLISGLAENLQTLKNGKNPKYTVETEFRHFAQLQSNNQAAYYTRTQYESYRSYVATKINRNKKPLLSGLQKESSCSIRTICYELDKRRLTGITCLRDNLNVSMNVLTLSAFTMCFTYLLKIEQLDVLLAISTRESSKSFQGIGCFINLLFLAARIDHNDLFSQYLGYMLTNFNTILKYRYIPYQLLVSDLNALAKTHNPGPSSQTSLFPSILYVYNKVESNNAYFSEQGVTLDSIDKSVSEFEIKFEVLELEQSIQLKLHYNKAHPFDEIMKPEKSDFPNLCLCLISGFLEQVCMTKEISNVVTMKTLLEQLMETILSGSVG